jgi:hypothetical protein
MYNSQISCHLRNCGDYTKKIEHYIVQIFTPSSCSYYRQRIWRKARITTSSQNKSRQTNWLPWTSFSWLLSQFLHANGRIIPQIRPWPLPSLPFPIHSNRNSLKSLGLTADSYKPRALPPTIQDIHNHLSSNLRRWHKKGYHGLPTYIETDGPVDPRLHEAWSDE